MSDPNNKAKPESSAQSSGPREIGNHETLDPGAHATASYGSGSQRGLKQSTLSPPTTQDAAAGATQGDPYLGCTVDDRYKVEAVLGEGGMGIVYRCRHTVIGKKVAMKVLRASMARDSELTERFLNEARSASSIGNPHIIDISDFGRLPDGSTYFIMEYLEGQALSDLIDNGGPVPVPRILNIAQQLAEGLYDAHQAGIVHRDLKPDNIFLVPRGAQKDFVKILDFGIAKASSAEGKLTRAGAVFGTPHYMSPEQAAGAPVDHRGDIYSMGVILYELASGKVPFDADNFMGILTQHMYKAPVPIRALAPAPQDVPPGLEAVVLKCLSKRPEQRYQTMQELAQELEKLRSGLIPQAVPEMMARSGGFNVPSDYFKKAGMPAPVPAMPASSMRGRSRWPLYAGIAGVVAAVGLVGAIFTKSRFSDASPADTSSASPVAPPASLASAPVEIPKDEPVVLHRQVVLATEPLDAQVLHGDQDFGPSPVLFDVEEGSPVRIEIRREGYKPVQVTLDGSEGRKSVKLEPVARAPTPQRARPQPAPKPDPVPESAPKPRPKPKPKPALGGGEIVDPWAD